LLILKRVAESRLWDNLWDKPRDVSVQNRWRPVKEIKLT